MSALDLIAFDSVQATGYSQTTARTLSSAVDQSEAGQPGHALTASARRLRIRYSTTASSRITASRIIAIACA